MSRKPPQVLSKSRYISGLQCSKKLWIEAREPYLIPRPSAATQAVFDRGHEVGFLAQQLFPRGLEINPSNRIWKTAAAATQKALTLRRTLYEPAFVSGGAGCRVDILDPVEEDRWDLYEVKSGTSVKEPNPSDVALQAHVLRGAGVDVRNYYVLHLDPDYVRRGELELENLFKRKNVNEQVRERLPEVPGHIAQMHQELASEMRPEVEIGPHCSKPYTCSVRNVCWGFLPERSVFTLRRDRGRTKGFSLLERGIQDLSDVPSDVPLTDQQAIQVAAERTGEPHVDPAVIHQFLATLEYPLYYFDLETIAPAVPLFDGTSPFRPQVPFQFSMHIVESPTAEAQHISFLAQGPDDPRPDLLQRLREVGGDRGSVVVYNQSFEKRVLRDAVEQYPEHAGWLDGFIERFVDLMIPFSNFSHYHPDQLGSASLKAVLPPLTGLSYEGMEIADGEAASREFLRVTHGEVDAADRQRVRERLETYCHLDTWAMIEIVRALERLLQ